MQAVRVLLIQFVTTVVAISTLLTLSTQAQTEKIIYSFSGTTDGYHPFGGLISDTNGNLYGVTQGGGSYGSGTVFELAPASSGRWTKTVLYSFGSGLDGGFPISNMVFDGKGNLYGIASQGGNHVMGGIFELSPGSNGTWSEQLIYSFTGGSDVVCYQSSRIVIDGAGNLFGYRCGGYGSIFELEPKSNGTWAERILHTFSGGNDGSAAYGVQLSIDSSGNLYGQAWNGPRDFGIVFELVRGATGTWSEKILHTFTGAAGGDAGAGSPIVQDANGNLFGASNWNVFELIPGSNGTWTEKILHTFTGGSDGAYADSGLTMSSSGKIYGATSEGGLHRGTIFELTPAANGTWTERILHRFTPTGGDGVYPSFSTLVMDKQGNLYGTTVSGGPSTFGFGVVFEVTP